MRLVTRKNETDVSSRVEDLQELARLLDDGKITQREFEVVKTELLEAPIEEWASSPIEVEALPVELDELPVGIPVEQNGHSEDNRPEVFAELVDAPDEAEPESDPEWLVFAKQIPQLYWASLGCALLSVLLGGTIAPIAWITAAVSIVALFMVKEKGMRWMAWTGLAVGLLFSMFGLFASSSDDVAVAEPLATASADSAAPAEIPVGSLGIEFADLKEGWNAVPDPPLIVTGITTSPEVGPLDSFLYRFDDAAVLAGAYNLADGYVYGLMAKVGIRHEALSNMFVHVCYLLYPGTQDCFDKFMEESGVYGKTPEELAEGDFSTSWTFKGNEWRVEVVDDIETIRVLGPVQAG